MTRIFVGNLSFHTTEDDVRALFASCGEVASVELEIDRNTGMSRGFCYVTMNSGLEKAFGLDGSELDGRPIKVNEARMEERHVHSAGHRGGRSRR